MQMRPLFSLSGAATALLAVTACANAHANAQSSQYVSSACPIPSELRGYPVSTSSSAALDTAFLSTVARAMAANLSGEFIDPKDKWLAPQAVEAMTAALDRGDIFERHSWRPAPGDTATLRVIYYPGKPAPEMALETHGALTPFQGAVERAAQSALDTSDPSPSRHPLPLTVPVPNADSVVVTVAFGREPDSRSGSAHFSIHEEKVRPMPGNQPPSYPTNARAAGFEGVVEVAFTVRPDSTAELSSLYVISSPRPDFVAAIRNSLRSSRYTPAEIDCRLVPTVVRQPFTFKIDRQPLAGQ